MNELEDETEELLLYNLVYCSCARVDLDTSAIEAIVRGARKNNARDQITGWLVYSSGIFFQWLEGGQEVVKRLMGNIEVDPRHNTVTVLSEAEEVRERLFSAWDMELVSAEDIRAVLSDALSASNDSKSTAALHRLIQELDSRLIDSDNNAEQAG